MRLFPAISGSRQQAVDVLSLLNFRPRPTDGYIFDLLGFEGHLADAGSDVLWAFHNRVEQLQEVPSLT